MAQKSLEKRFLRLVSAEGRILSDSSQTLDAAGLQDGDQLTAVAGQPKLAATREVFAFYHADAVVTWGHPQHGCDSSAVQDQLRNVQHIQATRYAFAAILEDGSVVTWGSPGKGGDSSAVQDQLRNVQQIQATT